MAWEHRDHVGLLVVIGDWVRVRPKRCHKCCHRPRYGYVVNLRADSGCPSDGIRVV